MIIGAFACLGFSRPKWILVTSTRIHLMLDMCFLVAHGCPLLKSISFSQSEITPGHVLRVTQCPKLSLAHLLRKLHCNNQSGVYSNYNTRCFEYEPLGKVRNTVVRVAPWIKIFNSQCAKCAQKSTLLLFPDTDSWWTHMISLTSLGIKGPLIRMVHTGCVQQKYKNWCNTSWLMCCWFFYF